MRETDAMTTVGEVPRLPAGLAEELDRQAERCRPSSPLYGFLLRELAGDVRAGGIAAGLLGPYDNEPTAFVPGLRLMAAVHALVLGGQAPRLAAYYPSAGGHGPPDRAWPEFRRVLHEHTERIAELVAQPVQTNETGRSAALYGGLLTIAAATGLPIRLHEIGASAGLNLRADRFAYRMGGRLLGDPQSALVLDEPWDGLPDAPEGTQVRVIERLGCDLRPIDPATPEGALRLKSLTWADPARIERIGHAVAIARATPATVDAANADEWLASRLADPVPGAVSVVWHSVVRQYVEPDRWRRVGAILAQAGDAATSAAPVAHLSFEPDIGPDGLYTFAVRLTLWPGGRSRLLAIAAAHGIPTRWQTEER
ncbi:MAG: hypothetical protein JWO79_3635 [Actinomycetia bacterium]|jgi:hypothetical protein|nr:hypothetical protein [Actinomycetes bacterium]MDQ1657449.1 hypothetical protein [Cryptosporangiaceae bacterium]